MADLFADAELAQRIEAFVALENERMASTARLLWPDGGAETRWVGGGSAVFVAAGAPVNQASGLALDGPVGPDHIDELEAFFASRGLRAYVNVCPLAHRSLTAELSRRGYTVEGFENVLVRPLSDDAPVPKPDPAIELREVDENDAGLWGRTVVIGFAAPSEPTIAELAFGEVIAHARGVRRFMAYVDGEPAATAELVIHEGLGLLSADTTLPAFQGRGLQTALQRRRLQLAAEAGCDLAVTESKPGSGSQRNMERLGFRIAYTRVDMRQPE